MSKYLTTTSFLALSLLTAFSYGSTIRDDRSDSDYLSLGSEFANVCRVIGSGGGSGTLIGSQWVLTAGHVFWGGTSGTALFDNGDSYTVDQVIEWPGWDLGYYDLALAHLSTPVVGVTPAPFWGGGSEVGMASISVGYGSTGTGLTGNINGWGTKRGFENTIDGYDETLWGFAYHGLITDFDSPSSDSNSLGLINSSPTAMNLEGCGAPGDSGGGLFITVGGQRILVGVTSYVAWEGVDPWASRPSNIYGYYGDISGYSRVADAKQWIYQNTGIAAVPEPSSLIALVLISILAARRRKAS